MGASNMQCVRPSFAAARSTSRSRISNRSRLLPGVDGRSASARRFRDICVAYEAEAGGNVSEVERDLIRQAAGLTLRAEQMQAAIVRGEDVNNDELVRISSTAKRLLETIRSKAEKRKPSAPSLAEYLAARAEQADDGEAEE
jgi:hypothetical protein